MIGSVRCML